MSFKKLKGLSFLGSFFSLHVLKKIFRINQRGKKDFETAYANDRIFTISELQRSLMLEYSQCYHCRICDTVCPHITDKPHRPAPSYIAGTFARSLTDFDLFDEKFDCGNCNECEKICPQNVPIKRVVGFIKEGKKKIISAKGGSAFG